MLPNAYISRLTSAVSQFNTHLCVGLDPDISKIPAFFKSPKLTHSQIVADFLAEIITQTSDIAMGFKPNLAFFEALGRSGWETFFDCVESIPSDNIIVADAKRGDIGNTASHYAQAFFTHPKIDSLTVNPMMGFETLAPFLQYSGKAIYVLTLTSNAGANDFFTQQLNSDFTISEYIAESLRAINQDSLAHIGMVVGATQTEQASKILDLFPESSLLMPGVGAQGAQPSDISALLSKAKTPAVIPISRAILYPKADNLMDFKNAVRSAAKSFATALAPKFMPHA